MPRRMAVLPTRMTSLLPEDGFHVQQSAAQHAVVSAEDSRLMDVCLADEISDHRMRFAEFGWGADDDQLGCLGFIQRIRKIRLLQRGFLPGQAAIFRQVQWQRFTVDFLRNRFRNPAGISGLGSNR